MTATTFGNDQWLGDGWIGYLMSDMKPISGRWHVRGDLWGFVPDDHRAGQVFSPDTEWIVLEGYWGERADVLDFDRQWQKARYEEPDHDHCAICWETLGSGGQLDGYVSEDATWVCCRCYQSFVQQRSLEFIAPHNPQ